MSKQLSNGIAPGDVKVFLKLSDLKPLHAMWIVDTYNHLRKQNDSIIKGFNAEGITEAIKFANDIVTRVENSFDKHRQQPLHLLLFLLIVLIKNMNLVKI